MMPAARLVLLTALVLPWSALAQQPRIQINGRAASHRDLQIIAQLERASGRPAVAGAYWYDDATGALGTWGGPTLTFLSPGLGLGGTLPAHASGGGDGRLTGVFINGREIHPQDAQALSAMLGTPVLPGRWWVDAQGNAGREGGPALFNLMQIARQNGRGGNSYYRKKDNYDGTHDSTFVGQGCAAVHGHTGSGETKRDYSYYVGCE
jgi:hypothetical protein